MGYPARLRRAPHDKPQTGKATRAAVRLSAGRYVGCNVVRYFRINSTAKEDPVSLPRLGKVSAARLTDEVPRCARSLAGQFFER